MFSFITVNEYTKSMILAFLVFNVFSIKIFIITVSFFLNRFWEYQIYFRFQWILFIFMTFPIYLELYWKLNSSVVLSKKSHTAIFMIFLIVYIFSTWWQLLYDVKMTISSKMHWYFIGYFVSKSKYRVAWTLFDSGMLNSVSSFC